MADDPLLADPLLEDPSHREGADAPAAVGGNGRGGAKHYTVLARRYRPQTFAEVIGQGHVARALTNAIAAGRVAHAYLFTGARGVGKTSTARIFAKALNCPNAPKEGPNAGVPCNQCEICDAVSEGNDVDVLEIDGASNNGVDHIRDLRGNVTVKPMRARYKVYIIDEVHMLSKAAFNALLKTLEEPPAGVKFVFCTTEPNKLPDTILSRVQRFDFATVHVQNIIQRLAAIAEAEGYEVEQPALELVARRAAGSMRDSQSLFDQLLSFGGAKITAEEVHRLFGTASDDRLVALVGYCVNGDPAGALAELEAAIGDGVQLDELIDQLVGYLRDLMILAAGADGVPLLGVSEEFRSALSEQAQDWGVQTTLAAVQLLSEAKLRMQRVTFGRALAEAALVRAATLGDLDDLAGLAESLRGGGSPSGATAPARNRPPARPAPRNSPSPSRQEPVAPRPPGAAAIQEERPTPAPAPPPRREEPQAERAEPDEPEAPAVPSVPLKAGNEGLLLSRLKELIGAGNALTGVRESSALAILGPDRVELRFPAALKVAAERCEAKRPAVEAALRTIVGAPVSFAVALDAAPANGAARQEAKPERSARDASRPEPVNPDDIADPFVRRAVDLFEARQVTSQPLPPAAASVPD
ncbi:DNA polymerase III subunit gamma/tau [Alienimonas californiensis]|uniref:DNA polymerase III subunit gamma/tau n=1 Tax=Alienimonas californiensis TaxID=2527989 RepID=A0A517PBH7_9PLAN|nr:DNA polymerase III subunit gamma/tau [Alienimonas californiensis]QDT16733.1 DNA polymerase III subunit tau [Alienimonas californiensis]